MKAIVGPTASGKTAYAISLAKKTGATIVNFDTRQFLFDLPILSCSPTEEEKAQVPHKLFNVLKEKPSLGWFIKELQRIEEEVILEGGKVILVGGSVFYLLALQKGVPIGEISYETRNWYKNLQDPKEELEKIQHLFPSSQKDPYRIESYLCFHKEFGCNFENFPRKYKPELEIIYKDTSNLESNIRSRTRKNFSAYAAEVSPLKEEDYYSNTIGFLEMQKYNKGEISAEECENLINLHTWQYAKYQRKFCKKLKIQEYVEE